MKRIVLLITGIVLFSCTDNKRTQEPAGTLPYESSEVVFKSAGGDVTLAATLATPVNDSLQTAVVLVSGSGPDDRDYKNQFGHKPFLVLSHYLTQKGITVLRYDERGVGKSEGNYREATYENLIRDAAGGVNYLRERGFNRVGLIGHSEGGGVAPAAALQTKTDFLVLMAPDNATADYSLHHQTQARLRSLSNDEAINREILTNLDSLLAILKSEQDLQLARNRMEKFMAEKEKAASDEYKKTAGQLGDVNRLIQGFFDPKFIYRLRHDPKDTFRKVRVPVLILFGDQDTLVEPDLKLIENAFDSTQHEIRIFPGMGHLFMNSQGVPLEKLHEINETIAPEVLSTISKWILKQ